MYLTNPKEWLDTDGDNNLYDDDNDNKLIEKMHSH